MEAEVRVRIQSLADILVARQHGRALAAQLGFSNSHLAIIATAILSSSAGTASRIISPGARDWTAGPFGRTDRCRRYHGRVAKTDSITIEAAGKEVVITNPSKVFFPGLGSMSAKAIVPPGFSTRMASRRKRSRVSK